MKKIFTIIVLNLTVVTIADSQIDIVHQLAAGGIFYSQKGALISSYSPGGGSGVVYVSTPVNTSEGLPWISYYAYFALYKPNKN